jgi:hypothetical protein
MINIIFRPHQTQKNTKNIFQKTFYAETNGSLIIDWIKGFLERHHQKNYHLSWRTSKSEKFYMHEFYTKYKFVKKKKRKKKEALYRYIICQLDMW